jgi:hypothetical protein
MAASGLSEVIGGLGMVTILLALVEVALAVDEPRRKAIRAGIMVATCDLDTCASTEASVIDAHPL